MTGLAFLAAGIGLAVLLVLALGALLRGPKWEPFELANVGKSPPADLRPLEPGSFDPLPPAPWPPADNDGFHR